MQRHSGLTLFRAVALAGVALATADAAEPAGSRTADPAEILSKVKQATGGDAWDAIRTDHVKAKLTTGGMGGAIESWGDVLKGRFVDHVALGPVTGTQGFDGGTL